MASWRARPVDGQVRLATLIVVRRLGILIVGEGWYTDQTATMRNSSWNSLERGECQLGPMPKVQQIILPGIPSMHKGPRGTSASAQALGRIGLDVDIPWEEGDQMRYRGRSVINFTPT